MDIRDRIIMLPTSLLRGWTNESESTAYQMEKILLELLERIEKLEKA